MKVHHTTQTIMRNISVLIKCIRRTKGHFPAGVRGGGVAKLDIYS